MLECSFSVILKFSSGIHWKSAVSRKTCILRGQNSYLFSHKQLHELHAQCGAKSNFEQDFSACSSCCSWGISFERAFLAFQMGKSSEVPCVRSDSPLFEFLIVAARCSASVLTCSCRQTDIPLVDKDFANNLGFLPYSEKNNFLVGKNTFFLFLSLPLPLLLVESLWSAILW